MKQISAICLLCLLLFNWYGYQFVINYFQIKADKELNAQLDNHQYTEADLIELRIPLNMPYQNNSSTFERVYGEVNYNGIIYSFVKRKIEDGYLILKCIPNAQKESIQKESREIAKHNNGIDQDQKSSLPNGKVLKSQISDFVQHSFLYSIRPFKNECLITAISGTFHTCKGFKDPHIQPPDSIS